MTVGARSAEPPESRVVEAATQALDRLRSYLHSHPDGPDDVRVTVTDEPEELAVPREALILFARVLSHLAAGHGVAVLPVNTELTTQQAADLLNVSRPFLVRLLESGQIRYRMVGSHRRVDLHSLLEYKRTDDARMLRAANELTTLDEELGLVPRLDLYK
jgi:excisionase family DNA binding protein